MRPVRNRPVGLLAIVTVTIALLPSCQSSGERAVTFEVEPSLRAGPVSGYFQIPSGGKPESTSLKRPTLDELGITWSAQVGLGLRARAASHDLYLDGRWLFLTGEGHASGDFTSQGEEFPDGAKLESDSGIGTWALTYGYSIPLGSEVSGWTLAPRVGITGVTARFKVDGDHGGRTNRSFTHLVPTLGVELVLAPEASAWRFLLRGQTTLTYRDRNLHVTDIGARFGREFSESLEGWLELGYQHFYLQDSQTFPNQLNIEFGPTLGVGIDWRF